MALTLLMTKAWVAALLALGAIGLIGTAGAQASCAQMPSLQVAVASAPLVFVGTVVSTSDGDRVARVSVESIWKGPDLPAYVDVHGSPSSGSGAATSVDRRFRTGERELFVLFSDRAPYQDNSCSATQPYTEALSALAPDDARPAAPPTAGEELQYLVSLFWPPVLIALLVVAVAAFIMRRRSRSTG
jgi:hypothetical protein